MKVVMSIHLGRFGDAGADEVEDVFPATTQAERRLRRIKRSYESNLCSKFHRSIARQSVIGEIFGQAGFVDNPGTTDISGSSAHVKFETAVGRDPDLHLAAQ